MFSSLFWSNKLLIEYLSFLLSFCLFVPDVDIESECNEIFDVEFINESIIGPFFSSFGEVNPFWYWFKLRLDLELVGDVTCDVFFDEWFEPAFTEYCICFFIPF